MNSRFIKLPVFIRSLCIFAAFMIGLASITGSGDDSSSSSTDYEMLYPTFNFDTIAASYDGTQTVVKYCTDPTTMSAEAQETYPDETRDLRIVDWSIDALDVKYENAIWSSLGSLQTIVCESSLEGSKGDGSIHVTTIQLGSSAWMPVEDDAVFTNYLNEPDAEFQLCVLCRDSNLYNNYQLNYLVRMELTLTVAYEEPEAGAE